MDDYKKYLAEHVLSEDKVITYRALSRALKVNVNIAKQMLFEFHHWQNEKRPGAVHATYMIYGTRKALHTNGHAQGGEDVEMSSSPPVPASVAEDVPVATLSLVTEENLTEMLSGYEVVTAIHVYSLGPHPVKDLQLLADISRPLVDVPTEGVSSESSKGLGPIRNPYVRRRDRRGAVPKLAASAPKPVEKKLAPAKSAPAPEKPAPAPEVKEEPKHDSKPSSKESTPVPSGKQKPAPKRGASGGIMQSFAKAASKPKKTESSQPAPIAADQSSVPALSDDGEDDAMDMPEPKKEQDPGWKSRKDRQEELKRMMEESSEDEEPEKEDTPMEDPEEETAPPPEPEQKQKDEPAEIVSSTGDGRRRGKRRVMRKKTVMDDQGYLVTVQEPGWESFSEDEPAPPPKKKVEAAAQPAKPKKSAPKGQGSIMSFFGKK